jgi:hypothetical protein
MHAGNGTFNGTIQRQAGILSLDSGCRSIRGSRAVMSFLASLYQSAFESQPSANIAIFHSIALAGMIAEIAGD